MQGVACGVINVANKNCGYIVEIADNAKPGYGYIAENGFELVEPNKYFIASPIGDNGLFEVTRLEDGESNKPRKQSHGIWGEYS